MVLQATHIVQVDVLITAKVVDEIINICKITDVMKDDDMLFVYITDDKQIDKLKQLEYVVKVYENPQFRPFSPEKSKGKNP
jgi:hypothetical protein